MLISLIQNMIYGHRRDPYGYNKAVEKIDQKLSEIYARLCDNDLLIITADHGCDPTFRGTDHTRENVPLLILSKNKPGKNLGIRISFSEITKILLHFFH